MKKYIVYTCATIAAFAMGCSDFGDTNVSPNASQTPSTFGLLTNALTAIGGSTTGGANLTAGLYCQYFAETLYTDASRYSVQDVDWAGELAGSIYDLQNIININTDPATAPTAALTGSNAHQIAIARILKAYRFSVLTDRYGDMPYSEALQKNTQPVFDTQESIYTDLFKELKEAVAQFDGGPTVKGDILFGGNVTRWKKFANSWRLILALRISNVNPTLGKAEFNEALNADGGVLSSNDDDINLTYTGASTAFNNPWYGIGGDDNVCTTIADLLNDTGDLRRGAFGKPASNKSLVGVPPGLQRQDAIDYTSANSSHSLILNDKYRTQTSTLSILTYADVLLARAEAAEIGWTTEDADVLYPDAITASWAHWGMVDKEADSPTTPLDTTAALADYLADPAIDLGAAGSRIEKIWLQRWITFYPNGPQGWSEWRRTGIPVLSPAPEPVNTSGQIPVRFIYPTNEYGINGTKLKEAVGRMDKGDTQDSHVWWDK